MPRPWASLFCAANPFRVTWSEQVFFSDAPTEYLHRDFVGRRRTGTRHGNVYRSVREKQGIVYRQRVLQTVTSLCVSFTSFSRGEFINLSRAQRAYHARIASELRFRFGHKSFYRFGIRSCLATSHKQILKTPFNMTSSCILGFPATFVETWAHFIHPLFIVRWQIAKYF